jgi:hypothetical protein
MRRCRRRSRSTSKFSLGGETCEPRLLRTSAVQPSAVQCRAAQRSAAQCSAVQRSAAQCSAAQCSPVQCSAAQCSPVQCSAMQRSAVPRSAVQPSAVQCSAAQCSAVQCSAVLTQLISVCVSAGLFHGFGHQVLLSTQYCLQLPDRLPPNQAPLHTQASHDGLQDTLPRLLVRAD